MTKPTVAQLVDMVSTLTTRLDAASAWAQDAQARIASLEEQDTKTRKQLWYLQKVAKGDFAIGSSAAKGDATKVAETVDTVDGCF